MGKTIVLRPKREEAPRARLNMEVDGELKNWVANYARSQGKNLTSFIVAHWGLLRRNEGGSYLSIFLDPSVMSWVKEYALQKRTTPEQLIVDYLVNLQEEDKGVGIEQV